MAFDDYEISVEGSRPVELYEFSYQGGNLRFTSADRDITFNSVLWRRSAISRTKIDESGDISKASLTLTGPPDWEVAALFDPSPPDDVVGLALYRLQLTDNTAEVEWLGRALSARWPKDQSEVRCESVFTLMTQPGLRRIYSKNCPHLLYGSRCQASELIFQESVTIDTQTGRTIISSDFATKPDGYYAGGKAIWEKTPGYFVRRGIRQHDSNEIIISHPMTDLPNGAVLTVLPGCDHTQNHCQPKFANGANFGGFPGMKKKNPFGQSSVF